MTGVTLEGGTSPSTSARPRAEVLRLADGVELIGEIEGSGFRKPPLLARRSDGQMVQLTKLLYAVAALADGRRDVHTMAEVLTRASNRSFTAADVLNLAEKRLRPVGVLALADGTSPQVPKREALMALRHRRPLVPERAVSALAAPLTWLHRPIVTVGLLLGLVAFDVWLFAIHGLGDPIRTALYNPELLLAVLASVVVATAFHELGHASACRYSGARPGVMGVGLYLVYPAFYCDVTDAYRLNRAGRLRTDLGGVYFNGVFALLAGGVYLATGEEAALLTAAVQHLIMLQQLLPLMRFDGYYVLTDLTGVPDILSRIKPILRSLVRGRDREPRVAELKSWVRVVVTAYLVTLVPVLFLLFTAMVVGAPRVVATALDSFGLQVDRFQATEGLAEAGVAALGILALVLPVAAMTLSMSRVSRMGGRGLLRWSQGSASRRVVALVAATVIVGAVAYTWWPNGDYEPIRPNERGTIGDMLTKMYDDELAPLRGRAFDAPDTRLNRQDPSLDGSTEADTTLTQRGADPGSWRKHTGAATLSPRERRAKAKHTEESSQTAPTSATDPTTTTTEPAPAPTGTSSTTTAEPTTAPDPTTTTTEPAPAPTDTSSTTTQEQNTASDPTTTTTTTTTEPAP